MSGLKGPHAHAARAGGEPIGDGPGQEHLRGEEREDVGVAALACVERSRERPVAVVEANPLLCGRQPLCEGDSGEGAAAGSPLGSGDRLPEPGQ